MSDDTEYDLDEVNSVRDAEAEAKTRADNRAERAERAERMAREGAQAMAEHHAAIKAVDERTVRLRSMRLAKEAADAQTKAAEKEAKAAAKGAAKKAVKKAAPKKTTAKD
ncbi:hypothetical protein SAMN02799622_01871 [Methylobacterium sp. UNC378MF]|uniref:hypothetical protein n=1 Tax=unclassified Methylobacterium TaxID=2615210 RepID=UPI000883E639|nr:MULTISPECIES: hypothetical protein [unclassified Methylobacterium]KAA0122623.1 hypothetical protein CIW48_17730 [Methylobacterium sp. P1-11]SDA17680.1 hypothetical protein SAMN02799622_01871 [Methylobacterium sp. UNC378MF]